MADLADFKNIGEELAPLVKQLFSLAGVKEEKADTAAEEKIINDLEKLIAEADQPTTGKLEECAEAIGANRRALSEVLIQDALRGNTLESTQVRIVETQRNALAASFGRLLERGVFDPIPALLDQTEISVIRADLQGATREIAQRKSASDILDTMVNLAVTGAKIATMLA